MQSAGGPVSTHLEKIMGALLACHEMVSLQLPIGSLQPCKSLPCCCAKQWQRRQLIVRSLMSDIDQGAWNSCIEQMAWGDFSIMSWKIATDTDELLMGTHR